MDQRIILFGAKGSGKSWLGNQIFILAGDSPPFMEGINKHFTCQRFQTKIGGTEMVVVEVPGIPVGESVITTKTWRDVIIAQNFCGEYTNVFIIVMDARNKEDGRLVTKLFLEYFGDVAKKMAVVVFTHLDISNEQNYSRALQVEFDFVFKDLGFSLPFLVWSRNDDITQQQKLIKMIKHVASGPTYTLKDFKEAQLKYLKNWKSGEKCKKKKNMTVTEMCEILEIPDILINRLFIFDKEYFQKAESIVQKHFK